MGEERITILEACKILHRSEKQVRRYVTTGKLSAEISEDGKYYILKSDVEHLSRHPDRLQEDKLARRMTGLEGRIDEIEKRLDSLSTHVDEIIEALYSMPTTRSETAKPSESHYKSNKSHSQKEPLPNDLIPSARFSEDHGIHPSTTKKAIVSGRLKDERNDWVSNRAAVKSAFNYAQQEAFIAAYRTSEKFHRCNNQDCPCQQDNQ